MKKTLLLLVCAVFALSNISAQEFISASGMFADRMMNPQKENTMKNRLGKYSQGQPMYAGETLQEAVARSSSPSLAMGPESLNPAFVTDITWGTLYAVDPGTSVPEVLFYTQTMERDTDGYYYASVEFIIYNSKFEEQYTLSFDLPNKCNWVVISENFSGAFWDTSTYNGLEFVIMVHYFNEPAGPETQVYDHYVYRSNNERIVTLSDVTGIFQYYDAGNSRLVVDKWLGYEAETVEMDIYEARKYVTAPEVKASYEFDANVTTNASNPMFGVMNVNNVNYYYFAYYELPFWAVKNPDWVVQQDNNYLIKFYDPKTYEEKKSFSIPFPQEDPLNPSEASFGFDFPEYTVTSNVFNDDDKWEFLFAHDQYIASCDCSRPIYSVYNEDGDIITKNGEPLEFPYMISSAKKLKDIPGFETQYALFHDSGEGITAISFFNLPSWTFGSTLEARHNGEMLSMGFDRHPAGDSYAYVFSMGETFTEDDNKFNKINWYNPDGSLYKEHRIYMTGDDYFFEAQVAASTLNPYLFNTDEKMEYIGFCGTTTTSGTSISVRIYNEDSELLFSAADDATKGSVGAGLFTVSDGKHWEYFMLTYKPTTGNRSYEFYELPLFAIGEGTGTVADPYVIRTAGDLDLVRNNPEASYIMANDIDMSTLLQTKYASGWESIPKFNGTLDGQGHTIRNFNIENSDGTYVSLIKDFTLSNAPDKDIWIKNLNIEDSRLTLNTNNHYAAFLVNSVSGDYAEGGYKVTLENIHIKGDIVDGGSFPSYGEIGALANSMLYHSYVQGCSFEGTIENASASSTSAVVGGLVGKLNNYVSIESSFTKGSISIANSTGATGGLLGDFVNNGLVSNCYSAMNVIATTKVGGLIGSSSSSESKGLVENSYAAGTVLSEAVSGNNFAGGVIGSTSENYGHMTMEWNEDYTDYTIKINKTNPNQIALVALNDKVTSTYPNRISGISAEAMSDWGLLAEIGVATLDSIKNCYALNTMLIGKLGEETAITSDVDTYIDGADITQSGLTQSFYNGIGWKFGQDAASPWVWNENGNPRLYIEFKVRSISMSMENALIDPHEIMLLMAEVVPVDAWNTNIVWSSSDNNIATVSDYGLVTGVDFGTATITATSEDGGYKATCEVKVGKVESIMFNKTTLTLVAGKDETLSVGSTPVGAAIGELTWESSDKAIALVDSNGRVTGVSIGNCTITATMKNTDLTAVCEVTIIGAESVSLNKNTLALGVGDNETLVATIDPADGLYTDLTWESSDNTVATVNAFGRVTGVKAGTCTIKVKLDGTDLFDTCDVTISEPDAINNLYANEVSIYPNPTSDKLYIKDAEGQIRVFDISGKLLNVVKAQNGETIIDLSSYEKGVYLINTGKAMVKVIKN